MSERKHIVLLLGFTLSVSLFAAFFTAIFLTNYYSHTMFQVLDGICQEITETQPAAAPAVTSALKSYLYQPYATADGSLLLSLLCSLFYNYWKYDIERIQLEEGDWQGRITGEIGADDLAAIQNFANVKSIVISEELSNGQEPFAIPMIRLHTTFGRRCNFKQDLRHLEPRFPQSG